jgi:hypothetical protein
MWIKGYGDRVLSGPEERQAEIVEAMVLLEDQVARVRTDGEE